MAALTNAIAAVGIGVGGNMTAFQAATGREWLGERAELPRASAIARTTTVLRNTNLVFTISSFRRRPAPPWCTKEHKAKPSQRSHGWRNAVL